MSKFKYIVLLSAVAIVLIFLFVLFWMPNTFEGDRVVLVSKGENFQQVVDSLERTGIVRSRSLFVLAGKILGSTTKMQIGKYRFKSGMSNWEILDDLKYGKSIEFITVTIPEGWKASRIARSYSRMLGIDSSKFMMLVQDSQFAKNLTNSDNSLEGYLMPKTYKFYWQEDEEVIVKEMVKKFWEVFTDTLRMRIDAKRLSVNEVVTLASIVEAETAIDSERALVAGVYYNRLNKNMRLEADPTVQYILEDGPRRLRFSDLHRDSPYNTYRHYGLPPGPINNPGLEAIKAVLYPKIHCYLYFVANGQGGHVFSKTFTEHQRAKQKYKRIRDEQRAMKQEG
jgi:UPF0755 protein